MSSTLRSIAASVPRLARWRPAVSSLRGPSHATFFRSTHLSPSWRSPMGVRTFGASAVQRQGAAAAAATNASPSKDDIFRKFEELEAEGVVHPNVIRTITKDMGFSDMTDVQMATINESLSGVDLVGQAKTGTGKTLAFLIPIFQKIIEKDPSLATRSYGRSSASDIRAIIISPTRELAEQIAHEARTISRNTGVIVQAAVGGTQKMRMLSQTQREGCHILVATPGRLADLLSDPRSRIDAPNLNMFVMDEADRLLDQGFWPEIQNIRRMLPNPATSDVQTLMFSATIPNEVVSAVRETLKPGFRFIKCVRDDEEPTHTRVPQKLVRVVGMQNYLPAVYELCVREIQERSKNPDAVPFKAIVYFGTTALVELAAQTLNRINMGMNSPLGRTAIFNMHSKLTQANRQRESDSFRRAKSAILLSSDVTARGMDFPNVTHVIQVGVPSSDDQYIHRIGRTARAGKEGTGYLFINPLEERIARQRLGRLPLQPDTSLAAARVDMTKEGDVPQGVANILQDVVKASSQIPGLVKLDAYRSLLGINQFVDDKQALIDSMNDLSRYGWGMDRPPALNPSLIHKLGLSRVRGLSLQGSNYGDNSWDSDSGGGRFGRGGYGGGGRGGYGNDRGGYGGQQRDAFDESLIGQDGKRKARW